MTDSLFPAHNMPPAVLGFSIALAIIPLLFFIPVKSKIKYWFLGFVFLYVGTSNSSWPPIDDNIFWYAALAVFLFNIAFLIEQAKTDIALKHTGLSILAANLWGMFSYTTYCLFNRCHDVGASFVNLFAFILFSCMGILFICFALAKHIDKKRSNDTMPSTRG